MSQIQLPGWASRARAVTRALFDVYVILWVVRGALELLDLIFDLDVPGVGMSGWVNAILLGALGAWLAFGVVWLAGATAAGWNEPREKA